VELKASISKRRIADGKSLSDWSVCIPIEKIDKASRKVFGWGSVSTNDAGHLVVDHDGDIIEPAELEKAAHDYVRSSGVGGVMHERSGAAPKVVSKLIEAIYLDKEKRGAMGLPGDGPVGFWVGYQVEDPETWARVESGELKEFSIHGEGERVPVDGHPGIFKLKNMSWDEISLVDAGAGVDVNVALAKARKDPEMKLLPIAKLIKYFPEADRKAVSKKLEALGKQATLADIKAKLTAEEWDVVVAELAAAAMPPEEPDADPGPDVVPEDPEMQKNKKHTETPDAIAKERAELTKQLEAQKAENAEIHKRLAAVEKERKIEKYRGEAKTLAAYYPAPTGQVIELLIEADDHPDKEIGKMRREAILKTSEALSQSKLLAAFGSDAAGDAADPEAAMLAKARKKVADGVAKSLPAAIKMVADEDPRLYTEAAKKTTRA